MRLSQEERLRALFEAHQGEWVALPTILSMGIAQYNARLFSLRRKGMAIKNKTQMIDGVIHSWYGYKITEVQQEMFA